MGRLVGDHWLYNKACRKTNLMFLAVIARWEYRNTLMLLPVKCVQVGFFKLTVCHVIISIQLLFLATSCRFQIA